MRQAETLAGVLSGSGASGAERSLTFAKGGSRASLPR